MPIYEYACPCGEKAERLENATRKPKPLWCPACGTPMQRVISAPNVPSDGRYSFNDKRGGA
jgi:putative FmdB family regulatory protein